MGRLAVSIVATGFCPCSLLISNYLYSNTPCVRCQGVGGSNLASNFEVSDTIAAFCCILGPVSFLIDFLKFNGLHNYVMITR